MIKWREHRVALSRCQRAARVLVKATGMCLLMVTAARAAIPAPGLASDTNLATAGFYQLSWTTGARAVELQESTNAGFRNPVTLYTGPDHSAVLSGKPDGTWFYRVRADADSGHSPWSTTLRVTVEHHSLTRAILFLALGVLVFLSIVVMIVRAGEAE